MKEVEVAAVRLEYPGLPDEYFRYLADVGWGESESGRMIYERPISPEGVYGPQLRESDFILLGDDMQGYSLSFDTATGTLGEISDSGEWEPWPDGESFSDYVRSS